MTENVIDLTRDDTDDVSVKQTLRIPLRRQCFNAKRSMCSQHKDGYWRSIHTENVIDLARDDTGDQSVKQTLRTPLRRQCFNAKRSINPQHKDGYWRSILVYDDGCGGLGFADEFVFYD